MDWESVREIFRLTVRGHSGDPLVLIWIDKVTIGAGVLEKAELRLVVLVKAPAVIRILQSTRICGCAALLTAGWWCETHTERSSTSTSVSAVDPRQRVGTRLYGGMNERQRGRAL